MRPGASAGVSAGVSGDVGWPTEADEDLREQVHRVVAAVARLGGAVGWLSEPARAESDAWLDGLLAGVRAGRARLAVVRDGGRVQALGYWAWLEAAVLSRNAELRKVMTHPDARGRGLARRLVSALVDDARAAGIETLVLDVRGNNHGAMALYEAEGFEVYGRLPDFIAVGADRFDRVLYRLELGRPTGIVRHGGRAEGPGSSGFPALSTRLGPA